MAFSWQLLRAGSLRLDGGGMFGVVPKPIWSSFVEPDSKNRIPLQTNCLLLRDGDDLVLVETGFGGKWTEKERGFFDLEHRTILHALREIHVDPADIDAVIVTHLHFDHAGGLTHLDRAGKVVPSFPNARVVVQRTEWEDARANKSTMSKTYLPSHLEPIKDQLHLVDGEDNLFPGLTVLPMPGHTWGQQAVIFRDDEDGMVCFPGDVMPTIHHARPAFSMGYDMLPHRNMQSKMALLERAAHEDWRLVLDHEVDEPIVRVVEDDGRWVLVGDERATERRSVGAAEG